MKANRILITGGAGFIGCNLANRLIAEGHMVTILDKLSRFGSNLNLAWLRDTHGRGLVSIPALRTDRFRRSSERQRRRPARLSPRRPGSCHNIGSGTPGGLP